MLFSDIIIPCPKFMPELLGKTTSLITGGSRGIGRAIGIEYARNGAERIYFVSRGQTAEKEAEALQTAEDIKALGAEAVWIKADLSTDQGIENTLSKLGKIDIFVSNAGDTFDCLAEKNTPQLLDASYNLNLRAPVLLASQLKARGLFAASTRVIFIASIIGFEPNTGQISYGTMKAGILQATKILAMEWGPEGMRVNAISPGFVTTELTSNIPQEALPILEDMTPLNRLGTPKDIAGAAVFLASNLSSFVNGANIVTDGGLGGMAGAGFILHDAKYRRLTARQMRELEMD